MEHPKMNINRTENNGRGKFFIEEGGYILAEMTYRWDGPDRIIIEHTEVGPELKGIGAGKRMVAEAVKFARDNGVKIIPHCPFARSILEKTPEYRDVL
jgi:predicted GNAT family acetyltransferase